MSVYREKPRQRTSTSPSRVLGKTLLILLLLAGVASAFFLLFLRGYVVDTPAGPRLQLPLLSAQATQPEADAVFSQAPGVTVPDGAPDTRSPLSPLHAIRLDMQVVEEGRAEEAMRKAGCNAVIVDMRDESGALSYVSKLPEAIESGASDASPGRNAAISRMNANPNLYSIARISCFSDEKIGALLPAWTILRAGGVPWRDADARPWLSPEQDAVQTYLLEICREVSALGFDEILLTTCAYPAGDVQGLSSDPAQVAQARARTLDTFYGAVQRTLREEGVNFSLCLETETQEIAAGAALNGQSPEQLLLSADRIWTKDDPTHAQAVFAARGLTAVDLPLVSIQKQKGSASSSWAIY